MPDNDKINVSVLVLFNSDKTRFKESIASIKKQSLKNIEIIVNDDGKKDFLHDETSTVKFVKSEKQKSNISLLQNLIENASGKYIAFNTSNPYYSFDFFRLLLEYQKCYPETSTISRIYQKDKFNNTYKFNNSLDALFEKIDCNSEDYFSILRDCPEIFYFENRIFEKVKLIEILQKLANSGSVNIFADISYEYLSKSSSLYVTQNASILVNEDVFKKFTDELNTDSKISKYCKEKSYNSTFEITGAFNGNLYEKIPVVFENPLDNAKRQILDNDVISFDIFDTLLLRPFWHPEDLFDLLNLFVNEEFDIPDYIDFKNLRIEAEHSARAKAENANYEVLIDDIYQELKETTCFSPTQLDLIKSKEIELEYSLCYPRKTGVELFNFAKYANKKIVITSDMYLDREILERMLDKLSCFGYERFYLSNELKHNKALGGIYNFLKNDYPNKKILHIGDTFQTDCENARKNGIDYFYLPKTVDVLKETHPISVFFKRLYQTDNFGFDGFAFHSKNIFSTNFRLRLLWKIIANNLFDNPFIDFQKDSEFSMNHYLMGASVGGLFSYTFISEILNRKSNYDSIVLAGRDCYCIKRILNSLYPKEEKYKYIKLSRKSLFPLSISKTSGIQLNSLGLVNNISPKDIFYLSSSVMECSESQFLNFCSKMKISFVEKFPSQIKFDKFCSEYVKKFFNENKCSEFKNTLEKYFGSYFVGKTLFVDMGYSGRIESLLKSVYGYDIDSLYLLHRGEQFNTRKTAKNLSINALLPFQSVENMWLRELLNSDLSGSCISYKTDDNGNIVPVEKEVSYNYRNVAIIKSFQMGMLGFVLSVQKYLGNYTKYIKIEDSLEGVLPFELFSISMVDNDKKSFLPCAFEDSIGLGDNVSFNQLFSYINYPRVSSKGNSVDDFIGSQSKLKKILFLFLFKRNLFYEKLKNRIRNKWFFKYLKAIYHIFK